MLELVVILTGASCAAVGYMVGVATVYESQRRQRREEAARWMNEFEGAYGLPSDVGY